MRGINEATIYNTYIQPEWAPPSWVFGPVWSVLYTIIFLSFGWVFYQIFKGKIPKIVALPFIINLISNAAFTPLQFGLQNNYLAFLDILIVWGSIIGMMKVIWPYSKTIAYAQVPYFLWVSFATFLQLNITLLNL